MEISGYYKQSQTQKMHYKFFLVETSKCYGFNVQLINPKVEIRRVDNTPDDPRQRKPVITKANELLGWEPKIKLRDGLPLMENDFRQRLGIAKNA